MIFPVQQVPSSYISADMNAIILLVAICATAAFVGWFIREEAKEAYLHAQQNPVQKI